MTVTADGLVWVREPGTGDGIGPEPHEANLEPVLRQLLGNGVFVDIGAHVGRWALRLAGQASKVIAVEANPDTALVLCKNIELNGLTNVQVVEGAAWDAYAKFSLDDPFRQVRGGSTRIVPASAGNVLGFPLDEVLANEPEISLIKLDVEGADLHALRGLSKTLKRCLPVLFIEDHSVLEYYKQQDLFALLDELGYGWRTGGTYMEAQYWIAEAK